MTLGIDPLLMVVLALVFGLSIGYLLRYFLVKKQAENAEVKAKEIIFKAKDQALKILEEEKKRLSSDFDNVRNKEKEIGDLRIELSDSIESHKKELERIGGVKKEKTKALLLKQIENESKDEIYQKIKKLGNEGNQEIENKARELLISVVQRFAHSQIAEVTTTAVSLPSDEIKGKIIGKEGRNIKAIERLTGGDIII